MRTIAKNQKKFVIINGGLGITLLILALFTNPVSVYSVQTTCQSGGGGYCANLAQISASGLAQTINAAGDGAGGAGDILARIYTTSTVFVALAAFVMFTIGGVTYLIAGDNQNRVTQAKTFMTNAIMGLAIALLSWLVLFTINPDLVRTLSVNLPKLTLPGVNIETRPQPSAWKCPYLPFTYSNQFLCELICDPVGIGFIVGDICVPASS
jgi:hypothetical protein